MWYGMIALKPFIDTVELVYANRPIFATQEKSPGAYIDRARSSYDGSF